LPFWWGGWPSYRRVTAAEMKRHGLWPLLDYTEEVAQLCGLEWFSTELTLSDGPETSRHTIWGAGGVERPLVAIDYVIDQCDVDVQSRWPGAPPDAVVRHVAERFAEEAAAGRRERVRWEGLPQLAAA